jgi:hypothetical protein
VSGSGDLTPLSDEDQAELFGSRQVVRLPFADVDSQFQRRHELLRLLIVLVFLALAVEALIGAWQSRRRVKKGAR